ncbi:DUF3244 domain-containing protein [Larkinella sp. VNQ87]|uniref:DUF3244 domain-containing protein n=1 Tax=Larkinella sp. VNQ87 TaxID=3400921 RepID=UPI003C0EBD7D
MFNILSNLICTAALMSAPLSNDPAAPQKVLPFDASAYVTSDNKIRVAIEKSAPEPVAVLLRNAQNEIVFQDFVMKKELKYAVRLDMKNLADGAYELEFKSSKGSIRKQVNLATKPVNEPIRMVVLNTSTK